MNYIETLRSPRRRLTIAAGVVLLHVVMIYGWFNLRLYGNPHRQALLIRVNIVNDVARQPHTPRQPALPQGTVERTGIEQRSE